MSKSKSLYLVNPASDMPSYHGAEVMAHLGLAPAALMADLVVTTVAALVPDDFAVSICDEHISPVNIDSSADFIGITGRSTQVERMLTLAREFRRRGKVVMIGGPYATLCPEVVRSHCDILVRGEIEDIAAQLFSDLKEGNWKPEYVGSRPDPVSPPLPRWHLYSNERALMGSVQTSRGCPFECEFCDVTQYVGRKQRHKPVPQVLKELDVLYKTGYRNIFLADDNFTAHRQRTLELLAALRDWNNRQTHDRVTFVTQASIDAADEDEILRLCSEAGLIEVFIGFESPNRESLGEVKKRQNLGRKAREQVHRFLEYGIAVSGAVIVGFDADGPDTFERQYDFAMSMPVPVFDLGALVAPPGTPLYRRLKKAGRLISETYVGDYPALWTTNVIPLQITRDELFSGIKELGNRLYHPEAFGRRMLWFIDTIKEQKPSEKVINRPITADAAVVVRNIPRLGKEEEKMFSKVMAASSQKPFSNKYVMGMLFRYMQVRHMYSKIPG
jgi:radical SAM superfamily enzyme YgiQ (UPF0313 family)